MGIASTVLIEKGLAQLIWPEVAEGTARWLWSEGKAMDDAVVASGHDAFLPA